MNDVLRVIASVAAALLLAWGLLLGWLWVRRPGEMTLRESMALLPDLVRMLRGVAADPACPRLLRWRLWALVAYLALPLDLVPDFIPVLGYADDVIAVMVVLRSVVRLAGPEMIRRHWHGGGAGLSVVLRLAGASGAPDSPSRDRIG